MSMLDTDNPTIWINPMQYIEEHLLIDVMAFDDDGKDRIEKRQSVLTIRYKGHTFYWNPPGDDGIGGVTCAQTGKLVLNTKCRTQQDIMPLLKSQLDLRWKEYEQLVVTHGALFNNLRNGLLWLIIM